MNNLDTPISHEEIPANSPIKKTNVMVEEFGIDIPVESVPLPSKGIIYDHDGDLHGSEVLDIKPMTAREEDILTSRAYIKNGTVLTKLIQSCLVNKNINPDDLISGDRNALLIALRITGYGSDYELEISCPACGKSSRNSFNLSELKIKRLEIDPVDIG